MPNVISRLVCNGYNAVRERPVRRAFRQFYAQLPEKKNVFYMFFPSGMMHWVRLASAFVPDSVNLVLVGSELTADERQWIATYRRHRPFFFIPIDVDHNTVWEMLFDSSEHSFGVIDSDLFILNADFFADLAAIPDNASLNCAYWYTAPGGTRVLNTHAIYVNVPVLRSIRGQGFATTPCTYNHSGNEIGRHRPFTYSRRPTKREHALLKRVMPVNEVGLTDYPSSLPEKFNYRCYDTLVMYQLVSNALGYRLNPVRNLSGISASPGHYSEELLHVNGVAYYRRFRDDQDERFRDFYRLILQVDFLVLRAMDEACESIPSYAMKRDEIRSELRRLGLAEQQCAENVMRYFDAKGVARTAFDHPVWAEMWRQFPTKINREGREETRRAEVVPNL